MRAAARAAEGTAGRMALWLALFGAVLAGWALSWHLAVAGGGGWLCLTVDVAVMPLGGFPVLAGMWAAMVAAMMLPTLAPALAAFLALPDRATGGAPAAAMLVLGYVSVWLAAAMGFAAAQAVLIRLGALTAGGALASPVAGAALLAVAGLWQLSRPKAACLTACARPELRLLARLTPGPAGALRLGLEIGIACLACCWALMALAFVGGTMSLVFMGLATLFMVAEKLPALGEPLRRPTGYALLAAAVLILGVPR